MADLMTLNTRCARPRCLTALFGPRDACDLDFLRLRVDAVNIALFCLFFFLLSIIGLNILPFIIGYIIAVGIAANFG